LNYKKSKRYPIGIGDDAALRTCEAGEQLIFTADTLVENVHFSLEYMTFQEVGYKAMAINVSDCAAMGALPDAALAQIVFPQENKNNAISLSMVRLYKGFKEACMVWDFPIIGGNLSKGPCWIIDITLIGSAKRGEGILKRKGAKKGDGLWVTGFPGSSAAGLAAIRKWGNRKKIPSTYGSLVDHHIRPIPRIEIGKTLAHDNRVHAMLDVSDGISKECHTLAFENNLGIILEASAMPLSSPMLELGKTLKTECSDWFLYGGEDYELLFAASQKFDPASWLKKNEVSLRQIGTFTDRVKGVHFKNINGTMVKVKKSGWDHLSNT
jgi:thiamine-monophosphate kinase